MKVAKEYGKLWECGKLSRDNMSHSALSACLHLPGRTFRPLRREQSKKSLYFERVVGSGVITSRSRFEYIAMSAHLALFHGPRKLADDDEKGKVISQKLKQAV
jgi:hypothetical protein